MAKRPETTAEAVPQQAKVTETQEIAMASGVEVASASPNELDDLFKEDSGLGLQNLGANDFAVPFFAILQKGSPQVSRANAKYIKGAESGMFMNTVSQELYDGEKGIEVIPCGYQKFVIEWVSRDEGGGLVAYHKPEDPFLRQCKPDDRGRLIAPNGHVLVDTAYHLCLILHGEDVMPEFGILSMASTQLKTSRMWNTTMKRITLKDKDGRAFNPPSFSHVYHVTTKGQTKDTYDWFGYSVIVKERVTDIGLYKAAKEFSRQILAGEVRVSAPPQEFEPSSEEAIPF